MTICANTGSVAIQEIAIESSLKFELTKQKTDQRYSGQNRNEANGERISIFHSLVCALFGLNVGQCISHYL